jgi:hypothetical protein
VFEHLPGKPEQRGEERNLIQRLHQDEWIPWRMCARLSSLFGSRLFNMALGLQATAIAAAACFAAWPSARASRPRPIFVVITGGGWEEEEEERRENENMSHFQ